MEELLLIHPGDLEMYNLIVAELILRKVLYENGYDSSIKLPFIYDYEPNSYDILDLDEQAFSAVFKQLGYEAEWAGDQNYWVTTFKIDIPELNGWSAQRLNRYRKDWMKQLNNMWDATLRFHTTDRKTSLIIAKETGRPFFLDMPDFIRRFLAWREIVKEVKDSGVNKRAA